MGSLIGGESEVVAVFGDEEKKAVVENDRESGDGGGDSEVEGEDGVALPAYPYRLIRSGGLDGAPVSVRSISEFSVEAGAEAEVEAVLEDVGVEVGEKIGSPYSSKPRNP